MIRWIKYFKPFKRYAWFYDDGVNHHWFRYLKDAEAFVLGEARYALHTT